MLDESRTGTEGKVLAYLGMRQAPCTSRDLHNGTGLTKDAVSAALRRLQEVGRVTKSGKGPGADGRPVQRYTLVTDSSNQAQDSDSK